MTEAERVVDLFMVKMVKDVRANLLKKQKLKAARYGRSANGNSRLWGSIRSQRAGNEFQLIMADYYFWVDAGRGKGGVSESGQKNIKDWIKRNGLNPVKILMEMREAQRKKNGTTKRKSGPYKKPTFAEAVDAFTYLTSLKLKREGYEGNHFYTEILNDGRLVQLKKDYAAAAGRDLKFEIKSALKI